MFRIRSTTVRSTEKLGIADNPITGRTRSNQLIIPKTMTKPKPRKVQICHLSATQKPLLRASTRNLHNTRHQWGATPLNLNSSAHYHGCSNINQSASYNPVYGSTRSSFSAKKRSKTDNVKINGPTFSVTLEHWLKNNNSWSYFLMLSLFVQYL